jgi:hypothetical protein
MSPEGEPVVSIPAWATLLLAALAALGIWFSLRGRVPLWLLMILTIAFVKIYASITAV